MSAIPCSRRKARPDHWSMWCVPEELDKPHAINDNGESLEYLILAGQGVQFREGVRIRHRDANTLNNMRHNLELVLTFVPTK